MCQGFWPATLLKRDTNTGVFLRIFEIFKNTYFELEILKYEICSYFLMSAIMRSLPRKGKKVY